MPKEIDDRIRFDDVHEIMEVDFGAYSFPDSASVNRFYDRIEERIAETGETYWFFLVNYSGMRIDSSAWLAFSRRGKALNMAHSQGSVRFDASEETRRQIERDAQTEAFDPNLFADRAGALARIGQLKSKRRKKIVHQPTLTPEAYELRLSFLPDETVMEFDLSNLTFHHSTDVHMFYDAVDRVIAPTDRKWFFLLNYENTRIMPEAWISYAQRGKALNQTYSLGSVRFAPGSETEADIRLRAESQDFRPNIRNTRDEALAQIADMKREYLSQPPVAHQKKHQLSQRFRRR